MNRNQTSKVENQIIDMARPFDTVRPVYHCHNDSTIPVVSTRVIKTLMNNKTLIQRHRVIVVMIDTWNKESLLI